MAGISLPWALAIFAVHAPVSELTWHCALLHRSRNVFAVLADLGGLALEGVV
jgi:hypothetical protein